MAGGKSWTHSEIRKGVRSPVSGGKPGPLRLKDLFVVVLVLLFCPSPGTDRPANVVVTSGAFHPALTAKTPGLHRSFFNATLVGSGKIVCVQGYRVCSDVLAGNFTICFA